MSVTRYGCSACACGRRWCSGMDQFLHEGSERRTASERSSKAAGDHLVNDESLSSSRRASRHVCLYANHGNRDQPGAPLVVQLATPTAQ